MSETEKRCTVLLGFDFDAESLWGAETSGTPTPKSRGTYGARVGIPRILDLLDEHQIKATFFIPAQTVRTHPDKVMEIHSKGHEVAHHGDSHKSPARMDKAEEKQALETGIKAIEDLTGVKPKGYRSPSWDLSPNSVQLFEEFGFLWDSSMMADDFQLYHLQDGSRQTKIVEIPVSWELDDAPYFLFSFSPAYRMGLSSPSRVFEIWSSEFEGAYTNNGFFILTMHPQIIGRWHRIKLLDKLIRHIKEHEGVCFAACSDAVREWLKQKS